MKKIIIACAAAIVIAGVSIFFIFGGLEGKKSSQRDEFAENNFETNQFATQNTNEFSHEFEYLPIAPTALGAISIEVMSFSERGISTSTEFLISSETQKLTAEHLKKTLSAKNGEEFSLEEKNENTFVLSLANEPENNTILNFIYEPEGFSATSFAFQTEDIFRVTATTPRHETYNIPTNTGIEINFSEKLDGGLDAFENAFSIDPHVDGKFFLRDETYIFSPTESLTPGTRYTVMISQKLSGETGAMAQNFIFSFDTNWSGEVYNNAPFFSVSGDAYETFLPWDEIFIALDFSYEFFEKKFSVKIFDLHNAENFLNFSEKNPRTFLEEFEIEAWVFEDRWQNRYYLMLEKSLPEGYYVAEINLLGTDNSARKFIQVSPISVYSAAIDGETVFWINDAASGEPAANAQIIADGTTAFTNAEGVAIVKTNENNRAEIIIRYVDYLPFAYTSPIFGEKKLHAYERFLSYIYTDRNVYRPDDTIDVFGVVKPLHGKSFSDGDFFSLRIGNIFSVPIILDEYNSFAVSVPVSNMMSGAGVDFFVNDEYLMGAYVFFADYTNLSYVISGESDKIVYQPNENAHVKISVTNFAGNPVSGVALNNRWDEKIPRIQTNSEGIASGILSVDKFEEQISWHPWWNNFSFATSGDSQISQSINFPHIIMPRDIMLETELSGSEIKIKTHRIDEKKLEKNNSRRWSELNSENFRGESVDINFELHVTQHITTRTIRSEQYDHINKRTVTTYDHNTTSAPYKIFHGRTENGEAVLYDLPVSNDPLIRFSMEVHYRDGKNRPTLTHVWHRWRYESEFESSVKNFVFAIEKNNLKIGETTKISIVEEKNFNWYWEGETNSDATPPNDGKMLAILIRDGVISATTGNPSGVSVTFSEAGISNTLVHGAYFDGKYIFPV
ncbi:MAG: Ig-like domain-containing protein, partial [Defluviitaleaceae bacterium]|nr:Ig-like domain-containing protein [Defluviitaleaceae bacterium]